jgi:glycosyltransferase involved in cell wall biosynthesis
MIAFRAMEPSDYDSALHRIQATPGRLRRASDATIGFMSRCVRMVLPRGGLLAPILAKVRRLSPNAGEPPRQREHADEFPEFLRVKPMRLPRRAKPRVVLAIGSLSAGGAERQLAAFAASPRTREFIEPVVLLSFEPEGATGHHAAPLRDAGVAIEVAGRTTDPAVVRALERDRKLVARLAALPPVIRAHVAAMAGELLRLKPDCVHAWLDHQNIWSGVAALVIGVPHVVLSTRNVNPTHFPYMSQPWFEGWYRLLLRSPRVTMINNSRPGADDYAAWLGYPREKIRVVLNGVDPSWIHRPDAVTVAALRRELIGECAASGDRPNLVGGVFRLSDEKQPFVWLEVARRLAAERPDVVFFHAGEGPLDEAFRAAGADLIAAGRLRVLGRRGDVPALLSAADLLLHTARFEGTPNVLLEASHLGCPIVGTKAGGAIDVVADGQTGFLCDPTDTESLVGRLREVLADEPLRRRMAEGGPRRIAMQFSLEQMVEGTLSAYPMLMPGR